VPLLARMVPSPLSVDIRGGAVEGLAALLRDQRISSRGQVAVVVGPGQGEQIIAVVRPAFQNAAVYPVEGGTVEAAIELADSLRAGSYDAVVGIGGGRTLDVAKYAASLTGLPMVAVATSLSHDGIASPVASLDHDGHKGSHGVNVPIAVVVDLDYVRASPPEQLRGGVGDVLSNLSAVADWELANTERGEPLDGLAVALARRRCSTGTTSSCRTPSSRRSPKASSSAALPWPPPVRAGRAAAPATRSRMRSTPSIPPRPLMASKSPSELSSRRISGSTSTCRLSTLRSAGTAWRESLEIST